MRDKSPFPKRRLWLGRGRVRGIRRHLREFRALPSLLEGWFPERDHDAPPGHTHWCLKLPIDQYFAEGPGASAQLKREIAQVLLTTGELLRSRKPADQGELRVVTSIHLPLLWDSRICIFWDEPSFEDECWLPMARREGPSLTLQPIPPDRSLRKEWGLGPPGVPEVGLIYDIEWDESEPWMRQESWFYGDVL